MSILYFIIVGIGLSRRSFQLSRSWAWRELVGMNALAALLSLVAAVESSSINMAPTIFFSEVLGFATIYIYWLIRNRGTYHSGSNIWDALGFWKLAFWCLVIGFGILIIVMTIYEYEPVVNLIAVIYLLVLFVVGVRWSLQQIKLLLQLKSEKAKTELVHLQNQVNPHFFFNMLNNLYGIVEQDSKKAQQLILKLSDMMRYSIYDGQKEWVTLEEEVAYLKNFVTLHQMRYHKKIEVTFDVEIEKEGLQVMPLLFVILLENAIKHGVEKLRSGAFVHIHLSTIGEEIDFRIENNYDPEELPEDAGIGLDNLKRRLELAYSDRHTISFSNNEGIYKARLSLQAI